MWKIAVCDDERFARERVCRMIRAFFDQNGIEATLFEFSSGEALLTALHEGFHILFLDVKMSGMDGFKTAEFVRNYDENVAIFFLTGYAQHARRGYLTHAYGYLLKPVDEYELYQNLKRALKRLRKKMEIIPVEFDEGIAMVQLNKIYYLENDSVHRRVKFWTETGCVESIENFAYWQETLENYGFYLVSSSCLVNSVQVKHLCREYVEVANETKIYFSQRRFKEFKEHMVQYLGGIN